MLVRLLPDDVQKRWLIVKEAILNDLPPRIRDSVLNSEDAINNLLFALLDGTLHCWILVEHEDKEPKIKAIITTTIVVDSPSSIKNLLLYSVTEFEELPHQLVIDSYKSLQEFAKGLKCSKILSFTDNPDNVKFAESIGGKATQTLIEMEVE